MILKDEDRLSPIVQGINLPIILLSGMLLPMILAPTWLRVIAHFNPAYYAVEAGRLLVAGQVFRAPVGEAFLFLVPLTILVVAWATKAFKNALS